MSTEPNPELLVVEVERSPPQLPTMNAAEERIASTDALLIVRNTVTSKICKRARRGRALALQTSCQAGSRRNVSAGRTSARHESRSTLRRSESHGSNFGDT